MNRFNQRSQRAAAEKVAALDTQPHGSSTGGEIRGAWCGVSAGRSLCDEAMT